MNFCSNCGAKELQLSLPPGDNRPRLVCQRCQTIHYTNPKIIVGCLPTWEDKVLLCRRAIEPMLGYWNLPAGFLEIEEAVEEGAMREVREEAAAEVRMAGLHTVFTSLRFHHVYLLFRAELVDGQFGVGEETLESRLFAESEVPWGEIAFHSSVYALRQYFDDLRHGRFLVHLGSH